MKYSHFIVISVIFKLVKISAYHCTKSVWWLTTCFTKFSILIKVSWQKRHIGNSCAFVPLYLHRFNHLSIFFKNLWTERTGGNHKASGGCQYGSELPHHWQTYQGRKVLRTITSIQTFDHFSFFIKDIVTEGAGEVWMNQGKVRSPSLLRCNWLDQNVVMRKIYPTKAWPTKHIYIKHIIYSYLKKSDIPAEWERRDYSSLIFFLWVSKPSLKSIWFVNYLTP